MTQLASKPGWRRCRASSTISDIITHCLIYLVFLPDPGACFFEYFFPPCLKLRHGYSSQFKMRLSLPPQSSGAVAPCPGLPSFLQLPRPLAFMTGSLEASYLCLYAGSCQQELGYKMGVYTENVLPVCLPSLNLCSFFAKKKNSAPALMTSYFICICKRLPLSQGSSPRSPGS